MLTGDHSLFKQPFWKRLILASMMLSLFHNTTSQELFPFTEPASTIPKGVIGIRPFYRMYPEVDIKRRMFALRVMYGLLPKLTVMATISVTNHHGNDLPPNLVTHTHSGNQTFYFTNTIPRGIRYPYQLSGLYLYAKYRFLTIDRKHQHFRMGVYADWSNVGVAHDESEPTLMDDTRGYGGGLIATYLNKHFSASLTGGLIIPKYYDGFSPDFGIPVETRIHYGRAVLYNLSFGYLAHPKTYSDYGQTNVNLYVELMGKSFEAATVTQFGNVNVPIQTPILDKGYYVEVYPSVQAIFDSNLRVDFSVGFPIIKRSYARFYPVYSVSLQRYIFRGERKLKIKNAKARYGRYNG